MIWLYERGREVLSIETRFDDATSEFELIWNQPDGTRAMERFSTEDAFRARLSTIEETLRAAEWSSAPASPQIMRDGWRLS
jgi:hypothetical protein